MGIATGKRCNEVKTADASATNTDISLTKRKPGGPFHGYADYSVDI
jgi:hypothetical protein